MKPQYHVGIDFGRGEDKTMYTILKSPNRIMRFINRLLKRGDSWQVIYCGEDPKQIKKWRYRNATKIGEA